MKRGIIVVIFLLIILSSQTYSKECEEIFKPKINLSSIEELSENTNFYRIISDEKLKYFNYYNINSNFQDFYINRSTYILNFTPTIEEWGQNYILFIAINNMNCYNSKLVNFEVFDKPNIIPLKPKEKLIELIEGQNLLFLIDVEDEDRDIKEYSWFINYEKQKGSLKEKFPFITNLNSSGMYNITVNVKDSKNFSDNFTWEVNVKKNNKAPQILANIPDYAGNKKIKTDSLSNYFSDPNKDMLKFEVLGKDEKGNKIDIKSFFGNNSELNIVAPQNFTGIIIIEIKAYDSEGAYTVLHFKFYVFDENQYNIIDKNICGDMVCNQNESCSICEADCGPCASGLDKCLNKWQCDSWSDCILPGYTIRNCIDLNGCIDKSKIPRTFDNCEISNSCSDGILNQREEKVDCGGVCLSCPTCFDKKKNQGEDDVDCSGPCEKSCPTCFDNIQNQMESDTDCGGPCQSCLNSEKCYSWNDCESRVCKSNICQTPTCFDNIKNGKEEGADCGKICENFCPTCFDKIKNQDEEKVDCGGICYPCESCIDKIKNQDEFYTDCGGQCKKCSFTDFKNNNSKLVFIFKIIFFIILLPIMFIISFNLFKKYLGTKNAEFLIILSKLFVRKKYFEDKREVLSKTLLKLDKLKRDIVDSPRKGIKEEVYIALSDFMQDFLSIDVVNDEKTSYEKLSKKKIRYPLNFLILFIIEEAKIIHINKYVSNIELVMKIEKIEDIISELEKKS